MRNLIHINPVTQLTKTTATVALLTILSAGSMTFAQETWKDKTRHAMKNPIVKQAAIGAAVGTVGGMISRESSPLKGAGVGILTGAGSGLIDSSRALEGHPYIRTAAKGGLIGTGVSTIAGKSKLKGAAIGVGAGTGVQLLKDYLDKR